MFAELILNYNSRDVDRLFTYSIPEEFSNLKIGSRVMVEFGRGNKLVDALVYKISTESNLKNIKKIIDVLPSKFSLSIYQLELLKSIRARYASTYAAAFLTVLPSVQKIDIKEKYIILKDINIFKAGEYVNKADLSKYIKRNTIKELLSSGTIKLKREYSIKTKSNKVEIVKSNFKDIDDALKSIRTNAVKQKRILMHIHGTKNQELKSLTSATNSTRSDILRLENMNLVKISVRLATIDSADYAVETKNIMDYDLSLEQAAALSVLEKELNENGHFRVLLKGITGSGKTRLYMQVAKKMISAGRQVLILLPEISLTPQIIGMFRVNLSEKIAVIHNKVNDREKQNHFEKIASGEVDIVIGARSALFAPFKDLSLIVLDEAHENSFVSELSPRYDTRELCFDLSSKLNINLIYGSATPSISLLYLTEMNLLKLISLNKRIGSAVLPQIKLVDMRNPVENNISDELVSAMRLRFERNEQVILLHNRKGYASFLQCKECGSVTKCINCDIPLKIHNFGNEMLCHYCSYKRSIDTRCEACNAPYDYEDIKGIGVEKYIEIFEQIFPNFRFERIDAQSVNTQAKLLEKLESFSKGSIDCLVGTQIVAKGLDFPNVTLIGILDSDQLTNMNDYMAMERAFQLITQVSGRAGRHEKKGLVLIQTFQPELSIYKYIIEDDFDGFVKREMKVRELLSYPPYSKLYLVSVRSDEAKKSKEQIDKIYSALKFLKNKMNLDLMIYNPSNNYMAKLKNKYIYNILMKGSKSEYGKVVNMLYILNVEIWKNIRVGDSQLYLDFNPIQI